MEPPFPMPETFDCLSFYAASLSSFLSSTFVQSLLQGHPNDVAIHGPPPDWHDWWDWATQLQPEDVLSLANGSLPPFPPDCIRDLLQILPRVCLPRPPVALQQHPGPLPRGQTPKKAHEVQLFSRLVGDMARRLRVRRVVDVGAGQGYLSLALASPPHSLSVLALDSSPVQTKGATHWAEQAAELNLNLRHATNHISSQTLPGLVSDWIVSPQRPQDAPFGKTESDVMLVGLHACGSLTVDVLRCFIDNVRGQASGTARWSAKSCAIVGCCYNLLDEKDTHLSRLPSPPLPSSALQLAAQPPLPPSPASLELSLRKLTYRALLGRLLHAHQIPIPPDKRVGRLKDSFYQTWPLYVRSACDRLGVEPSLLQDSLVWTEEMTRLTRGLSVLHVLRAALGPAIESWILLDRYVWLREELGSGVSEGVGATDGRRLGSVRLQWVFDSAVSARSAAFILQAS